MQSRKAWDDWYGEGARGGGGRGGGGGPVGEARGLSFSLPLTPRAAAARAGAAGRPAANDPVEAWQPPEGDEEGGSESHAAREEGGGAGLGLLGVARECGGRGRLLSPYWPPAAPGAPADVAVQLRRRLRARARGGASSPAAAAGAPPPLAARMSELLPLLHSLLRPAYLDPDVLAQAVQR